MLLILLSIFYLPVFILRSIIVRCFGPNYGIRILDDLFNPCTSSKHNDSTHERGIKMPTSPVHMKKERSENTPHRKVKFTDKMQNSNTIKKELELAEQALDRMIEMRHKCQSPSILANIDFQEISSYELP